ncbi:MAG: hypothetical protein V4550_11015 [Gemmatimonadota bacterium]
MKQMFLALLLLPVVAQPPSRRVASPRIVALLEGARIAVINSADGSTLAERSLGDTSRWTSGWTLGVSPSGANVFVALVARSEKETAVVRFDLTDYSVHQVAVLADSIAYPFLAVGQRSGRVFLGSEWGFRIAIVDPRTPANIVRYASGRDTMAFGPAFWFDVSASEARIYTSYHGGGNPTVEGGFRGGAGVDWIDISKSPFEPCKGSKMQLVGTRFPTTVGFGCGSAHGRMVPYGDGFVAASGGPMLHVYDSATVEIGSFRIGLGPRNHVMEFAVDSVKRVAYPIGPCEGAGGVNRVAISNPANAETAFAPLSTVCGERIVLSQDRRTAAVSSRDGFALFDIETGTTDRRVKLSAGIRDLAFVRD